MTVLSKAQDLGLVLGHTQCKDVLHPWTESCTLAALDIAVACFTGTMRFFTALYTIPLIVKYREVDRAKLWSTFKALIRSSLFTASLGASIFYFHCFFRWLLGRYHHSTSIMIPSAIGGLSIFIEDPGRWSTDLFALSNAVLEWLSTLAQRAAGVKLTAAQNTAIFMVFSGTLLYMIRSPTFRQHVSKSGLWFYFPERVKSEKVEADRHKAPVCPHEGTCLSSLIKESGKLMGLGTAVQLLRVLFKHITARPIVLLRNLASKENFRLGAFLGIYVAVYKAVSCLLCRTQGRDSELYAIPAGVLAGAAFRLHPDTSIGTSALTTIVQILTSQLLDTLGLSSWSYLKCLGIAVTTGLIVNALLTDPSSCPRLIGNVLDKGSNGRTVFLRTVVFNQLKRYHLEHFPITLAGIH